ncbi:TPR repeat region-containing protein [Nocardia sp. R6R-6]|uniref:TPR repeat region-containing protein n=1 Tax=Nocardia sp. R6R-6 TaxID=3459303 RepID=UPI00403E338A
MPTRAQVEAWRLEKLSEWAGELEADTQEYENQLGKILTHFTDATWSGKAHDAAADRFTEETDQGRRLSQEILATTAALRVADGRLADERRILLNRVADAVADGESPIPLTVDDKWTVSVTYLGAELSAQDRQKVKEKVEHHQGMINGAYYSLMNAVSEVGAAITANAQAIRARGDLLGDGVDAPTSTASDSAALGRDDGEAIRAALRPDGTIDPAVLDQIASRLPQGILSEHDVQALADGKEISTLPASTQQYYREFFQSAGKDGILALNDQLKAQEDAGNPTAAARRDALANGLLAVSNEKIGTGRDANGKLQSPGGYQELPQDLRDLVSSRWEGSADLSTTGDQPKKFQDLSRLGDLLSQSDEKIPPGKTLAVELSRQAASTADYFDKFEGNGHPIGYTTEDQEAINDGAGKLLSVGGRNNEANYALLTGEGIPEVPAPSPDTGEYHVQPFDRDKFTATVFGHDWGDDGKAPSQLIDWIGTESHDTGPDGKPTEQAILARRALAELPEVFAPSQDTDNSGDKPNVHRPGGLDAEAFGNNATKFAENPELSSALARVMGSNIDSYIEPFRESVYLPEGNETQLNQTDANRLLFLASQSDQGRLTLEVSRQAFESNVLTQAFTESGPGEFARPHLGELAMLDGRITNAAQNALTFQDQNKINDYNNTQQEIFEKKQAAAQIVADMTLGQLEIPNQVPGSQIANQVAEVLKEKATESAINNFISEPEAVLARYPDTGEINAQAERNFQQTLLNAANTAGYKVPDILMNETTGQPIDVTGTVSEKHRTALQDFMNNAGFSDEKFMDAYKAAHGIQTLQGLGTNGTSLQVILTGSEAGK